MTLFNIARGLITTMMHNEYSLKQGGQGYVHVIFLIFFSHL